MARTPRVCPHGTGDYYTCSTCNDEAWAKMRPATYWQNFPDTKRCQHGNVLKHCAQCVPHLLFTQVGKCPRCGWVMVRKMWLPITVYEAGQPKMSTCRDCAGKTDKLGRHRRARQRKSLRFDHQDRFRLPDGMTNREEPQTDDTQDLRATLLEILACPEFCSGVLTAEEKAALRGRLENIGQRNLAKVLGVSHGQVGNIQDRARLKLAKKLAAVVTDDKSWSPEFRALRLSFGGGRIGQKEVAAALAAGELYVPRAGDKFTASGRAAIVKGPGLRIEKVLPDSSDPPDEESVDPPDSPSIGNE